MVTGRTSGFYFDKAIGITIRNSSVKWGNNKPTYFAHARETHGVTGFTTTGFTGQSAFPAKVKAQQTYTP
jgi:hypothetical protein